MVSNEDVASFWRWFSEHSSELAAKSVLPDLVAQLETRLFAIARLDWEIGPGRNAANLFALSPRGDQEALQLTQSVIAQAPNLTDWEFYPAKPPRNWNLAFKLRVNDEAIEIDGKQWEFVAYEFNDGTYDLMFRSNSTQDLSEDYLNWAATIIVDGELGEEKRMKAIGNIEVVEAWDTKAAPAARKLEVGLLSKVIDQ